MKATEAIEKLRTQLFGIHHGSVISESHAKGVAHVLDATATIEPDLPPELTAAIRVAVAERGVSYSHITSKIGTLPVAQEENKVYAAIRSAYLQLNTAPNPAFPDPDQGALYMLRELTAKAMSPGPCILILDELQKLAAVMHCPAPPFALDASPSRKCLDVINVLVCYEAQADEREKKAFERLEERAQGFADERDKARRIEQETQNSINKLEQEYADLETELGAANEAIDQRNALIVDIMLRAPK